VRSLRQFYKDAARTLFVWLVLLCLIATQLDGLTLNDLRGDPDLTPARLISKFAHFKYVLHAEVQPPETFLASECGDCDDFATLAAMLLREKGYTPRLIAVRMPGLTHVVCYVAESGSYLDYNNREFFRPLVKTKPEITEIANKVARSFDSSWTSASEFLYTNQVKILVATIARAETFTTSAPRPNLPAIRPLDISF
jgi:hypothetical protein